MKIINQTAFKADELTTLLKTAAQTAGAKFKYIGTVKVNTSKRGFSGTAWCRGRKINNKPASPFGDVVLRIPVRMTIDALSFAEQLYKLAVHEFTHCADYQKGLYFTSGAKTGRRPAWANRPEERRAMAAEREAMQIMPADVQDTLIQFAMALDTWQRNNGCCIDKAKPRLNTGDKQFDDAWNGPAGTVWED